MRLASEAQLDPVVREPLALQALAHARFDHQIDRALFEQARTHTILRVLAAPSLHDHRLDSIEMQQVGKHQPGRPCSHDSHLCAHVFSAAVVTQRL